MPEPETAAHVRLALHPDDTSAVTATITGPNPYLAHATLFVAGFRKIDDQTMALVRIDRDEPHYADKAAQALRDEAATVEIDAALQEEIDIEWTYGNYPMPWLTREEVREVSAEAQRIHDDIASGRLIIHFHAHDGWTTVAVGTYRDSKSVHLHGENHLRQETDITCDTAAEAIAEFHRLYSVAVRPGPAPLTDLERTVRQLLAGKLPATTEHVPASSVEPPVAEPGEHEAFLAALFTDRTQWERYRPFDETAIACHESLTVRAGFDHEARHQTDVAWTIATYDGPVGDRLWHATVTAGTPVALIHTILQYVDVPPRAAGEGAPDVLRDAGWHPASHPARTTWTAAAGAITSSTPRGQRPTAGSCTEETTSTTRHGRSACPQAWTETSSPNSPPPPQPSSPSQPPRRGQRPPIGFRRPYPDRAPLVGDRAASAHGHRAAGRWRRRAGPAGDHSVQPRGGLVPGRG
ncbi:DUF317 domain-containing protein [Streptomyces sp. NPDC093225]|uniref:DUF317 domain-containing protein n=1 Tax=Streptomyces sp. NPDC093225 TaxID=3366034 RepID=UPI00380A298B